MKRFNIYTTVLMLSVLLFSCKKDGIQEVPTITIENGAQVKFFNFGVNAPSLNFYANSKKVSAVLSAIGTESPNGTAYGSVFPATNYSLLAVAQYTFNGIVSSKAVTNPGAVVATIQATVEAGKAYSLYTSGFYDVTAKTIDGFIVEDKIPAQNEEVAQVRFVNTISNGTAAMNLVIKNTTTLAETVVATNVAYKTGSEFTAVPNGVYEVYARYPNSNTNVISRVGTSVVSFIKGRSYTISSRGDMTVTGGTATNRPFLDNTSNRP